MHRSLVLSMGGFGTAPCGQGIHAIFDNLLIEKWTRLVAGPDCNQFSRIRISCENFFV